MTSYLKALLFPPELPKKAPEAPRQAPCKPRGGNPAPNHVLANQAKVEKARQRYKAVMGTDWVHTSKVEDRLGKGRGTALPVLRAFEGRGELECRPSESRYGFEWKWK